MSREKQIEEMRKEVAKAHRFFLEDDDYESLDDYIADELYNAGYRKQSENMVEVVRCKDCQYAYIDGDRAYCRNIQTPWYNDYFEVFTNTSDFCCYGAKMKGGAE